MGVMEEQDKSKDTAPASAPAREDSKDRYREDREDRVRVLRLIEYEGPRSLVERQVDASIHGTRYGFDSSSSRAPISPRNSVRITAVTLGQFPEIVQYAHDKLDPRLDQAYINRIVQLTKENEELRKTVDTCSTDTSDKETSE